MGKTVGEFKEKLMALKQEDAEVMSNLRSLKGEKYVAALEMAVDMMHLHLSFLRLMPPLMCELMKPSTAVIDGNLQAYLATQLGVDIEQFTSDVLMVVDRRTTRADNLLEGLLP